jgi:hypothetical protein
MTRRGEFMKIVILNNKALSFVWREVTITSYEV